MRINAHIDEFAARVQDMVDAHRAEKYPNLPRQTITVERGRRYAKLVSDETGSTSVFCFVDMTNGDVLKAESFRKPAKHVRGNVTNDDYGMGGVNVYGGNYMR